MFTLKALFVVILLLGQKRKYVSCVKMKKTFEVGKSNTRMNLLKPHGLLDNYDIGIRIVIASDVNYYLELNRDK